MSKKMDDLQQWIQDYDVPEAPENRMEKLISMGQSYMEGPEFNKNSLRNVFLSQLQYLPFLDCPGRIPYGSDSGSLPIRTF